jgi:hypothetical protein
MAQKPIRVLKGVPLINSKDEDDDLLPGQYAQGYDADGNLKVFKKGDNAPLSNKWGLQEEIINTLFLLGSGAKVFGALDYAAAKIVPGGDDPSLSEAISEVGSQRELFRETHPYLSAAGQAIGVVGPSAAVRGLGKIIGRTYVGRKVGSIPTWIRSIVEPAAITGTVAAGESDLGRELPEFESGAERGAATAAVLYPIFSGISLIGGGIRGRVNPGWGARNMINMATSRHDLARIAETASEEELAAMAPALRNMSPAYREIYRRVTELGPDAVLADAFPEGIPALLRLFTKQAGATRDMLKGILDNRATSETERLVAGIDLYVSNLTGDPLDPANDLSRAFVEMAGPHYDHAFDVKYEGEDSDLPSRDDNLPATQEQIEAASRRDFTHVPDYNTDLMSPELAKLLGTDSGRMAFSEALKSFGDEKFYSQYSRKQAELELQRILDTAVYEGGVLKGISSQAAGFSLEFLDRIKRKLDSRVSRAETSGDADTVRVVSKITNSLREELDRLDETGPHPGQRGNSGSYKRARDTAKSNFDLEKAYERGLLFRKATPKDIRVLFERMSEGEKNMYRAGSAAALRQLIEQTGVDARATPRIFGTTYNLDQIMALVSPDQRPGLKEMIARELTFIETERKSAGRGGGTLAADTASEEALQAVGVWGAGRAVPTVNILLLAGQVRRMISRFLQGGGADREAVQMLLEQDAKVNQGILQSLSALPQDSNTMRLRDLVVRAIALQTRTVGEDRVQVPVAPDQYEIRRQPRSPLGDILRGGYGAVRELIEQR